MRESVNEHLKYQKLLVVTSKGSVDWLRAALMKQLGKA